MSNEVRTGIVLMNLGSPDSTEVRDVKKYLDEFLMDKRVIDSPWLLRLLLVKGIIVPFRSPKSADAYKKIWTDQGSPLIVLTKQLEKKLQEQSSSPVAIAMRYGNPSPADAYKQLITEHPSIKEIILLPLYPHYAMSSYETAVEYAKEQFKQCETKLKLTIIKPYYDDPGYVKALAETIQAYTSEQYDHILFSYHGVPERHIYKGDITGNYCLKSADCCTTPSAAHKYCYRHQCTVTTQLVTKELGIPGSKYSMSFQSRLGRAEWLKPYTAVRLAEMPGEGIKNLLVVCPAFVSDCLETLEEIAQEGRHIFMEAGGESFTMIPCLNVHQSWVNLIDQWTADIAAGKKEMLLD